ncbi:hypothetical protein KC19_VG195400 [Ceratodon purpureus]|uniref:Uncharacterized protein n=1 Tax=Ceratodon purpureus TaxID=3225 RepID=A0A8T0HSV8_CERPU|nr:hypothetical protein KC19_VG195400 [Ceratodon purpureus]
MAKLTRGICTALGGVAPPTALRDLSRRLLSWVSTPSSRHFLPTLSPPSRPLTIISTCSAPNLSPLILREPPSQISFLSLLRHFSTLRGRLVPEIAVHFALFHNFWNAQSLRL